MIDLHAEFKNNCKLIIKLKDNYNKKDKNMLTIKVKTKNIRG